MALIDIFNGDADGICALLQLRAAEPADSRLVTGVKRDIALMENLECRAGDRLTVLDISMERNRKGLDRALAAGAEVFYVDHHFPGEIPPHPRLTAHIDTQAGVCTSTLVDGYLKGRFRAWAVVGAFGDNLQGSALKLAASLQLGEAELDLLERLGTCINYNSYGASLEDLFFAPARLFQILSGFTAPLDFIAACPEHFARLENGYREDMEQARAVTAEYAGKGAAVYTLPRAAWARRASGVYANELCRKFPGRAHAVVMESATGGDYVVSVRAPRQDHPMASRGADTLCREFPSGGGRRAAAGINQLPPGQLQEFIQRFRECYDG